MLWEGPPFGGGQWHPECRGDARTLSAVLADFARLDVKAKRIVLQDAVDHSFWLNPNNEPAKRKAARMDWSFTVWQPANWERLRKLPANLNPTGPENAKSGPPAGSPSRMVSCWKARSPTWSLASRSARRCG